MVYWAKLRVFSNLIELMVSSVGGTDASEPGKVVLDWFSSSI
jgi:hypothetical protein